jgi:hypothetical protein
MERRDGFLSRWSRLKRGADTAPKQEARDGAPPESDPKQPLPEGEELEELIAQLPKIEDLIPGQSLAAFMQPWVPTALRNAALQRMWLLDPAISGYVDPALDYAYDYNAIGGAPGFGPMETSQEAINEVAEMFDRAVGQSDSAKDDRPLIESADAPNNAEIGKEARARETNPPTPDDSSAPADDGHAASHKISSDANDLRPTPKRHGGALPV